jgi:hypothetical protein
MAGMVAQGVDDGQWALPDRNAADHDERQTGAGEGIRTLDPNLGKVVLYP